MKKLVLSLLFFVCSIPAFSQFTWEGFENTTGPSALPSTNWNLNSGGWTVFDNGVGTSRWGVVTTSSSSPLVYQGNTAAFIGNESNIGQGNTSEKWLVSPLTSTLLVGRTTLKFYSRTFTSGNQGTVYKIMIAPGMFAPSDSSVFTELMEWSENDASFNPFDIYKEITVDLSAFAGFDLYIAFVKVYTQTTATPNDDHWYIDNASINFDCGSTTTNCPTALGLIPFIDVNNNGIMDNGETRFSEGAFTYQTNNSGVSQYTYPGVYGLSYIFDNNHTDSYDISFSVNTALQPYFSCTTSYTNQNTPSNGITYLYFPITIVQPFTDVGITMSNNTPRAGFTNFNYILFQNNGYDIIPNGTISYTKDPNITISSAPAGATITPTGFTYNFTNLLPGEHRYLYCNTQVPSLPTVSIGQLLTNSVTIQVNNDAILANNSFSNTSAVRASYDPNIILESHGEKIVYSTFTFNDYLYYTIQFENTGTAYAQSIRVEEILNSDLDTTTFEMLTSSHSVATNRIGNHLTWKFDNINLPPTITNPDSSHGFITFKIKPKPGYAIGDIIPATASIYFDSNPAIVTNTFNTEFVQALSNATFSSDSVSIYPNPASNLVTISNTNSNEKIASVVIYEVSGKRILTLKNDSMSTISIDVSQFSKGIYLVDLLSENNSKVTKKLIIQ